jgi:hypothetical protein
LPSSSPPLNRSVNEKQKALVSPDSLRVLMIG